MVLHSKYQSTLLYDSEEKIFKDFLMKNKDFFGPKDHNLCKRVKRSLVSATYQYQNSGSYSFERSGLACTAQKLLSPL